MRSVDFLTRASSVLLRVTPVKNRYLSPQAVSFTSAPKKGDRQFDSDLRHRTISVFYGLSRNPFSTELRSGNQRE
ncbi:hypothetical protein JYU34_005571 [Plutella xylostella]|uniref:Uncharacterized protein n=1 Tax=Plutella xylostella TaxID=51655 RepID=A0ABQ7QTK7_PLUXY|nr:hypothetical protein JYU34_005571 [Plutella xylostella]